MVSKKLMSASEFERNLYKVSLSAYGIQWPLIDENLSVGALMKPRFPGTHNEDTTSGALKPMASKI